MDQSLCRMLLNRVSFIIQNKHLNTEYYVFVFTMQIGDLQQRAGRPVARSSFFWRRIDRRLIVGSANVR